MNIFLGSSENSIFKMEDFEQNQILEKPFYPTTLDNILDKKHNNYNYSNDWVRIIVCDIALATGEDNDNSIYIFMAINKKTGERRVENIDMKNGLNTVLQVMMIKRYFYDYKADYIMLDVKGNGAGIFDLLTTETYDAEFNKVYPAWTVCLDKKLQISSDVVMNDKIQRTISNNAEEVIIPYAGTSDLNSQMHLLLRKALKDKIISFLKDDSEMQYKIEDKDPTFATKSSEEKAFIMNPYLQTRLMINESVSLEIKFMDNGNIKLSEAKRTNTKDRYMTLAMANFLADKIHNKYLRGNEDSDLDEADFYEIYNY
jgi:Terminase-like family.